MAENKLGQLKTRKGWRYYWEPCPKSAISYWGEGACTVKSVVFCLTPSKPPQGLVLHYINVKHSQTKSKTGSECSWRKKNTYSINKLSILPPSQTPPGLARPYFYGLFFGHPSLKLLFHIPKICSLPTINPLFPLSLFNWVSCYLLYDGLTAY